MNTDRNTRTKSIHRNSLEIILFQKYIGNYFTPEIHSKLFCDNKTLSLFVQISEIKLENCYY